MVLRNPRTDPSHLARRLCYTLRMRRNPVLRGLKYRTCMMESGWCGVRGFLTSRADPSLSLSGEESLVKNRNKRLECNLTSSSDTGGTISQASLHISSAMGSRMMTVFLYTVRPQSNKDNMNLTSRSGRRMREGSRQPI